jgi:hypothetical protein
VAIRTTLPVPPGTVVRIQETTYGSGRPERGAWTETKTGGTPGDASSVLDFRSEVAPFSFRKIQIDGPASGGIMRILTDRGSGVRSEVRLIEVRDGKLICEADGRRIEIPIHSLGDDDQAFLEEWMKKN